MVSITSVADSPRGGKSTGNIYFFVAKESLKYKDLVKLNKATLLFSEAQNATCQMRSVDPMEPTCSRAMISGLVYRVSFRIFLLLNKHDQFLVSWQMERLTTKQVDRLS